MISSRTISTLGLFVVCMLLTAGCTVSNLSPAPNTSKIQPAPVQPSIYWIKIDPVGNKQVGEIFTVNSTTNLSVDNEILVQIYPTVFHHMMKNSVGSFSGDRGTVNVIQGKNGTNIISFIVNSSEANLIPQEYQVTEDAIYYDSTGNVQSNVTGQARFNVTSGKTY